MALLGGRMVLAVTAVVLAALGSAVPGATAAGPAQPVPAAGTEPARSYEGPSFASLPEGWPTEYETQNKLWFSDGAWWALMLTTSGALVIHELQPDHRWREASAALTTQPIAVGDVRAGADDVKVIFTRTEGLMFARLTYDEATRTYVLDPPGRVTVTDNGGRTASLDADTTGRLWIALATRDEILYTSSSDDGATWTPPVQPPVGAADVADGEIVGTIAFDESIGMMWSDQARSRFTFAVHRDSAPLDDWSLEVPLSGEGMADDHINLKVARGPEGDTVIAAVKTSQDDIVDNQAAPLMLVLARSPAGEWTSHVAGTVADKQNRSSVVIDETNDRIHFLSHAPASGGTVYIKSATLGDLSFTDGRGEALVEGEGRLADVTTPDHNVTAESGMVVLASSRDRGAYHHAEVAVPVPAGGTLDLPDDERPPPPPEDLLGTRSGGESVALYWSASVDTETWVPASDGRSAASYVVLRDGTPVGNAQGLSFVDRPPGPGRFEYAVAAVDQWGKQSDPSAPLAVDLVEEEAGFSGLWWYAALGAGTVVGALVLWRRRGPAV